MTRSGHLFGSWGIETIIECRRRRKPLFRGSASDRRSEATAFTAAVLGGLSRRRRLLCAPARAHSRKTRISIAQLRGGVRALSFPAAAPLDCVSVFIWAAVG